MPPMSSRPNPWIILFASLAAIALSLAPGGVQAAEKRPPNIVFMLADDKYE